MMFFAHGAKVTVKRDGPRDVHGDRAPVSEHVIEGCALDWGSTGENTAQSVDRSETSTSETTVLMPPDADVINHDEIVLPDGSEWRVDGKPKLWRHPMTGWTPGVEVKLKNSTTSPQGPVGQGGAS